MFKDRFADAKALPPIDEQQDYELTGFQESGGKTLLKFKRKFDTCDPRDRKLEVNFIEPEGIIIAIDKLISHFGGRGRAIETGRNDTWTNFCLE